MREARKSQLDAPNPFATLNQLTTPFTFTFSSGGFSGGSAWDPAVSSVTDASSVGVSAFSSVAALMASISERPHATHSLNCKKRILSTDAQRSSKQNGIGQIFQQHHQGTRRRFSWRKLAWNHNSKTLGLFARK